MKLTVATALALALFGCRSSDTTTCTPQPHQCTDGDSCCDPACSGANGVVIGEYPPTSCSTVGYECTLFEAVCDCGSDHLWSCRDTANIGHDLSVRLPLDLAPPTD